MKAIVTGAAGQCGPYLCGLLLKKGYEVYATMVEDLTEDLKKRVFESLATSQNLHFLRADVTDLYIMENLIKDIKPDEFYNLASFSHVQNSWSYPIEVAQINAIGTLICLEAIRKYSPNCRFVQFSTSELFGNTNESPQNERTSFCPRSPYATSKLFSHWIVVNYRENYELFACNAILYNMESPRRGEDFVTQKIARGVAKIKKQLDKKEKPTALTLGNLDTKRSWNYAKDSLQYVWKMLQLDKAEDFVIGSAENHSVREFVRLALEAAGLDFKEKGDKFFSSSGELLVYTDSRLFRKVEVKELIPDPSKAIKFLDYKVDMGFRDLVREMVKEALKYDY